MRIGAVTLYSARGAREANLQRIVSFGEQATDAGCRLVVFPEFSVCGPWVSYDAGADPGELSKQSEPVPGPSTEYLAAHARRLGIAFCVGIAETGLTSMPFNTQVVVDRDGVIHRQRKLQPTISEQAFFRSGGDVTSSFTLEGTTFGVVICADNAEPAVLDSFRNRGVDVILAPACGAIKKYQNPGSSWEELLDWYRTRAERTIPATARRLGVTVISVDAKDPRNAFDELPERPHYVAGMSLAYSAHGELVAGNTGNEETVMVVEV
jgi:predicted amidohydrolase